MHCVGIFSLENGRRDRVKSSGGFFSFTLFRSSLKTNVLSVIMAVQFDFNELLSVGGVLEEMVVVMTKLALDRF